MPARRVETAAEAVAVVQRSDTVAVGLGPAHPTGFLHALGERDDWVDLQMFGALLTDLYAVFTKPAVHFRSGFFGPAERFLRDSGADVQYVPADFRRFAPIVEQLAPRVMATAVAAPDADGWCSLSLHAGATVDELHRAGADPERVPHRGALGALPVHLRHRAGAPTSAPRRRDRRPRRDRRRAGRPRATPSPTTSTAPSPSTRRPTSPTARRCRPASAPSRR